MKSPKKPKKTAEQKAVEHRQRSMLDEEIEEQEGRFKALARGKLGRVSLLSGAPKTVSEAVRGSSRGGGSGVGSMGGMRSTTSGARTSGARSILSYGARR